MAKSNFIVRGGADFSGIDSKMKKLEKNFAGVQNKMSKSFNFKGLARTAASITGIALSVGGLVNMMKKYAETRNAVQRVNELFQESNKFINYFAENQSRAFGMAESTAYQYAMTYGNLFKGITKDTQENAKVTIAMMKASAVVASKTGRTMEDVNERIRSGILGNTEAIEDLGINVPIAMIKTTQAFKDVAKGAKWESLTYQQQQQIRVLAILEQATSQYGDSVSQISGWSLPRLGQAFKDLVSYAGMFVTAGLQPVINALGQLVVWATAGLKALAKLFGMKVEGTLASPVSSAGAGLAAGATGAEDMADGLGGAAKNAKKLKGQLAGFDAFNDITKTEAASGGGSGGAAVGGGGGGTSPFDGLAMPDFEMKEPDTSWVDGLQSKFEAFKNTNFFQGASESIQSAIALITPQLLKFKELFSGMWEDIKLLSTPFLEWFNGEFTVYFQEVIGSWGVVLSGLLDTFNAVFSDIWNIAIYPMLEKWTTKLLPMWTKIATEIVKTALTLFNEVKKIFDMVWQQGVRPAMELIMKIWSDFADLLVEKWEQIWSAYIRGN